MDCLEAQELVSAALDAEVNDAATLERAKEHCRTCPECAAYVRSLVLVRRAQAPEPPADLADRIMSTVRGIADAVDQSVESTNAGDGADAPLAPSLPAQPDPTPYQSVTEGPKASIPRRLLERLTDSRNRRTVVAWSATAAVVLVASGFGAVAGVRLMTGPRVATDGATLTYSEDTAAPQMSPPQATESATAPGQPAPYGDAAHSATASSEFIVVDGSVYRSTGIDGSVTKATLADEGVTLTALDSGATPVQRTVYGRGDPARVFIELDGGAMLGFDLVTTTFAGTTYVLRSGPIEAFGTPVSLPPDVPEPSASDGRPVFEPVVPELQPPVYVLTASDPSRGIALPPGARPEISASWTWWTPADR